jgi:hypothetical protein
MELMKIILARFEKLRVSSLFNLGRMRLIFWTAPPDNQIL